MSEFKSAFEGADSVFAVTVSDTSADLATATEYKQIVAIADAAQATGTFLVLRHTFPLSSSSSSLAS